MPFEMSSRGRRFMQMDRVARSFTERIPKHEEEAAAAATKQSKVIYERWKGHRPEAPERAGRPTTQGQFPGFLRWNRDARGNIRFDSADLETRAPYWLIQEVGTGQSARILNPAGEVSVRSQIGRRIPLSLQWADSQGSEPTRGSTAFGGFQQLYLTHLFGPDKDGNPRKPVRAGRIRREIKGKHYLRDGGLLGMSTLRRELMGDAEKTFRP
jgi:hypothetical protein